MGWLVLGLLVLAPITVSAAEAAQCDNIGGEEDATAVGECLGQVMIQRDSKKAARAAVDHGVGAGTKAVFGDKKVPVWVWWDYTDEETVQPDFFKSVKISWEKFAPADNFEFIYVNHTTVGHFLQDWPEECSRIYSTAQSDIVRAGLLAKYGGVYLDADILLGAPMLEITDKLQDHDFVTYSNTGQHCDKGDFSSNFQAARPGNALHVAWYAEIKRQVSAGCDEEGFKSDGRICCHTETGEMREECHVPWGIVGEKVGVPLLRKFMESTEEPQLRTYCFSEDHDADGFAPCPGCLWASIPRGGRSLYTREGKHEDCDLLQNGTFLECKDSTGIGPHINRVFARRAYHLANSIIPHEARGLSLHELETGSFVFSQLLREKGILSTNP